MQIQVEFQAGFQIMRLNGQLNARQARKFEQALLTALNQHQRLILDCSQLETMDSTGLGSLIRCLREAVKAEAVFLLASLQRMPQMVLEITHTAQLFHIYDSVAAAVQSLPQHLGQTEGVVA